MIGFPRGLENNSRVRSSRRARGAKHRDANRHGIATGGSNTRQHETNRPEAETRNPSMKSVSLRFRPIGKWVLPNRVKLVDLSRRFSAARRDRLAVFAAIPCVCSGVRLHRASYLWSDRTSSRPGRAKQIQMGDSSVNQRWAMSSAPTLALVEIDMALKDRGKPGIVKDGESLGFSQGYTAQIAVQIGAISGVDWRRAFCQAQRRGGSKSSQRQGVRRPGELSTR